MEKFYNYDTRSLRIWEEKKYWLYTKQVLIEKWQGAAFLLKIKKEKKAGVDADKLDDWGKDLRKKPIWCFCFSVSYKVRAVYGDWGNRAMCKGLRREAKIWDSW